MVGDAKKSAEIPPPFPPPKRLLLVIVLPVIRGAATGWEESPVTSMPPPPQPPSPPACVLLVMVLPRIRGDPFWTSIPIPQMAWLPVITLLMMVGEALRIKIPPPLTPEIGNA